ncbi:MAG TPA: integrase arm-type DNA-binding domain-containing protein [Methylotenera sp.]|nr:integrase arm-type DNA-binding domain-containing protein [Methylotenera sp.]HPH06113.1 integrase arm-type DNA-binding domain-containing protein [Methylotenera sp.]
MPLTYTQIEALKPLPKPYKISDAGGLTLLIQPTGSKWWRLNYRFNGKQKTISLGVYPQINLQQARIERDNAKKLLALGVDPSENRKEAKEQAKQAESNNFESVAREWHKLHLAKKSEHHQYRVKRWLEVYLFPKLGKKLVNEITAPQILAATASLQKQDKLETAHRIISVAGQVIKYAIQKGLATTNPARELAGALPMPTVKHMPAFVESKDVAKLLQAIDGYKGSLTVQCALKLAPLLFQRIGELRQMKWADVDFENKEWRHLVSKTKTPHIVPLSMQAIAILKDIQPYSGHLAHVFPGGRDPSNPMSENAINGALRKLGYDTQSDITGHGFRAIAQTLGEQELGFDPKHIERQLAHSVANPLGEAYERAQFLKARKIMMQQWADYLDKLKAGGDVLEFKHG